MSYILHGFLRNVPAWQLCPYGTDLRYQCIGRIAYMLITPLVMSQVFPTAAAWRPLSHRTESYHLGQRHHVTARLGQYGNLEQFYIHDALFSTSMYNLVTYHEAFE